MSRRTPRALIAVVFAAAVACSDAAPERSSGGAARVGDRAAPTGPRQPDDAAGRDRAGSTPEIDPSGDADRSTERSARGDRTGAGRHPGGGATKKRSNNPNEEATPPSAAAAGIPHPSAGLYVYRQSGYERYCSGAQCDREGLPKVQRARLRYASRSPGRVTVVSKGAVSKTRFVKTTTVYERDRAVIEEVLSRVSFGATSFSETYRPQPAVESLRFPLRAGMAWSGRWSGRVSGDYSISVVGSDEVAAAGRTVNALRLETVTSFEGQYEGRAQLTFWLDPRTNAIVRSAGRMNLKSALGTLETEFRIALASGPGY